MLRLQPARMLAPGLRALRRPAALAFRRPLHASSVRLDGAASGNGNETGAGNGTGGKPSDDSAAGQDEHVPPQTGSESSLGRSKMRASGSLKGRYARKQAAPALPPVQLPESFLKDNVTLHRRDRPPRLPTALQEDAKLLKVSSIFDGGRSSDSTPMARGSNGALEKYFDMALETLQEATAKLVDATDKGSLSEFELIENLEEAARLFDMLLDSAWHLADALYPARRPQYLYRSRPFWWWHYYKDYDGQTREFRDQFLHVAIDRLVVLGQRLNHPLSQAIADLPVLTFASIGAALKRELATRPPPNSETKTLKRQVTVLSMSGYSGQAISQSVAEHLAFLTGADVVRLDAQDLSILVGNYLGQDWAYSRGPLSNMGFRAAEMNGKLHREPDIAARTPEDEDNDPDTGVINIRTSGGTLEDDLSKIKQGGYDPFGKWEHLKIDKVLDQILQAANLKDGSPRRKPLVIHIHDYVELNMTLEGSMLISRLRNLVDAAWQQGTEIAILGTSSSEQPSEEYQSMLRELSVGDFVVTRHLDPSRSLDQPKRPGLLKRENQLPSLQDIDLLVENTRNINHMLKAIGGKKLPDFSNMFMQKILRDTDARAQMFKKAILPLPEVFSIATSSKDIVARQSPPVSDEKESDTGLFERLLLGPLRQRPGQRHLDESEAQSKAESEDAKKKAEEEAQATGRAALKLNEYEKRISSGHINRQNLRTTFEDVHVPKEIISALKLLTSLALVRPDAFSYGVLAQDKIPGCLLYGPPGTGKTLLAKAVAKESGANMLEVSGATINDKWVGESEKLIHAVFTFARKISPCVVFIDEADSLLANRSMLGARASHRSHINQFLKEWDGLEETEAFIMVATNRPFDLDDAVLRRLPRRLLVDLPLRADRASILKIILKGEDINPGVSLDDLASRTPYYSGSDLKNVCVAAAMAAVEEENEGAAAHTGPDPYEYPKKRTLHPRHFEKALKQIPASISEDMQSLKQIRKFDEEYGAKKRGKKKMMGFGIGLETKNVDAEEARIRRGP